jgi:hypothetical protein
MGIHQVTQRSVHVQKCEKSQTTYSIGTYNISLKRGQAGIEVIQGPNNFAPTYAVALACDGSLQLLTRCTS